MDIKKYMIICKICNQNMEGNGYCAEHSTGGTAYLSNMTKPLKETKKKEKRNKHWNTMVDILDGQFPKHKCKERGRALVMLAEIEFLLLYGEKEFRQKFGIWIKSLTKSRK